MNHRHLPYLIYTVSVNQTPMDWSGNVNRIIRALEDIARCNEDDPCVVLFPELSISAYGLEDYFFASHVDQKATQSVQEIALKAGELLPDSIVFCGMPFCYNDKIFNTMAAMHDSQVVGLNVKHQLANDGLHYESRFFSPWKTAEIQEVDFQKKPVPIGSPMYYWNDIVIGIEICRDSWVPNRPALHFPQNADLLLNPSASHFAMGKFNQRKSLVIDSSRSLKCIYAQVNLMGNESGRIIFDGSSIIANNGKLIQECRGFSFSDFIIQRTRIDNHDTRIARRKASSIYQELPNENRASKSAKPGCIIKLEKTHQSVGFFEKQSKINAGQQAQAVSMANSFKYRPAISSGKHIRFNEFLLATTLGLFDYLRKSHSKGFVVSLSGGADSASCALLIHRMIAFAVFELGSKEFLERIHRSDIHLENHIEGSRTNSVAKQNPHAMDENFPKTIQELTNKLLTSIYQSTRQSSEATSQNARKLAEEIGANHSSVQIDGIIDQYISLAESSINRNLAWQSDDLSLQNIQARSRSPMAWMLANIKSSLLITTGNRSEISVGYSTMDGDTSGGLAPISGVSKSFIRDFLLFMETSGDDISGPVKALQQLNEQEPSAELRPSSGADDRQKDEADLMPYDLLQRIEEMVVRYLYTPVQVLENLQKDDTFSKIEPQELIRYIKRFYQLWSANQWKRERLAPGFHLDDYSLDPRGWARFPVLNKSFEQELMDLDNPK